MAAYDRSGDCTHRPRTREVWREAEGRRLAAVAHPGDGREVRQRRRESVEASVARVRAECGAVGVSDADDLERSRAISRGIGQQKQEDTPAVRKRDAGDR